MQPEIENASRDRLRGERSYPEVVHQWPNGELVKQINLLDEKPYTEYTGTEFLWIIDKLGHLVHPGKIRAGIAKITHGQIIVHDYLLQLCDYLEGKAPLRLTATTCKALMAADSEDFYLFSDIRLHDTAPDGAAMQRLLELPFPEVVNILYLLVRYGPIGR